MSELALSHRPESLLHFTGTNRLPVILQTEMAECGLACLAMVLGFYGYSTDLACLRRRYPVSSQGTNLKTLIAVASELALASRAVRVEQEVIGELQLPCVLHWDMNHFVVLKSVGAKAIVIIDPAIGLRSLSHEEFSNHFTGVALELYPTDEFEPGEEIRRLKLSHFWRRIVGLKRSLLQIAFLSLLLQLLLVVSPFYMQTVVDDVLLRSDTHLLQVLALGFGLLLLIEVGAGVIRQYLILHLSSRLNIQIAANVFRHLIRLPMEYFQKRHMGDIVSRFGSLDQIRDLLTTGLVTAFVDGFMVCVTLVAMFVYDVRLTLLVLLFVAVYSLFRIALYRPLRDLSEQSIASHANAETSFMESVRAIQTVKLFEKENDRQQQWQNRLAEAINKDIRIGKLHIGYDAASTAIFGLENILVIYFAALAVMANTMTIGMLFAYVAYKRRFVSSIVSLIDNIVAIKMVGLHLHRLADIAHTPQEKLNHDFSEAESVVASRLAGHISITDLSFSYGGAEGEVFRDVSFEVPAGESIAIVGASGAGKTSLLKCMMGLLEAGSGDILVDGRPLAKISGYRSAIAAVMQDEQLFSGSIADNIACFDSKVDVEWMLECANMACIHEEIMEFPMQYNTLVGDLGSSLSGGQRQRIVLARALYKKPRILFLDEATSHLDVSNERLINENIAGLNITRIIVAHRPETIRAADKQYALGGAA